MSDILRRCDLTKNTEIELQIRNIMLRIEAEDANQHLTRAITSLEAARNAVADYVDAVPFKEEGDSASSPAHVDLSEMKFVTPLENTLNIALSDTVDILEHLDYSAMFDDADAGARELAIGHVNAARRLLRRDMDPWQIKNSEWAWNRLVAASKCGTVAKNKNESPDSASTLESALRDKLHHWIYATGPRLIENPCGVASLQFRIHAPDRGDEGSADEDTLHLAYSITEVFEGFDGSDDGWKSVPGIKYPQKRKIEEP